MNLAKEDGVSPEFPLLRHFEKARMRLSKSLPICTLLVSVNIIVSDAASARELVKACPAANVRSLATSAVVGKDAVARNDEPTIEVSPILTGKQKHLKWNVAIVTAYGPILGSMDSPKFDHAVSCAADGINIEINITRSENYQGAVLQNVNWVPKVVTRIESKLPEMVFHVRWKMTLSNGVVVGHSRTPPFPERKYPVLGDKTIRWK